jgi:hypothetical protein
MSKRRAEPTLSSALLVAGLLLLARKPDAEPPEAPTYVLTYAGPRACPGEATFIAHVASHVHDMSRAGSVRVNVTIEERGASYAGTSVAFDRSGRESWRRIEDKKCPDAANAPASLAAIVIEVGGHLEQGAVAPPPRPTTAPSPSPARRLRTRSVTKLSTFRRSVRAACAETSAPRPTRILERGASC